MIILHVYIIILHVYINILHVYMINYTCIHNYLAYIAEVCSKVEARMCYQITNVFL